MTDRGIVLTVRWTAAAGVAVALTGTGVSLATGHIGDWWSGQYGVATMIVVGLCALVWLIIPHQPRNAAVWAMAVAPLGAVVVLVNAAAPLLAGADASALRYPNYIPAEHPAALAWVFMVAEPLSNIGVWVPLSFGLLLFPTGAVPTPWRWVGWLAACSITALAAAYVVSYRPAATRSPEHGDVLGLSQFGVLVATLLAIVVVFARYRSSTAEARQQIKWVLWGGAVAVLAFGAGVATIGAHDLPLATLLIFCGFTTFVASYGIAMARYRLYDVDLVISRSIVYSTLAAIITGAYIGIVVGAGELLGSSDAPDTILAIATTAAVAVAFQPLRRRLQRLADRLVYGKRSTPHDVLSEFARLVSANDPRLLDTVARSLVDGTGASRAEIWVIVDGRPVSTAVWPPPDDAGQPDEETTLTIDHHGLELGSLILRVPRGQRLSEQDLLLAEQVAAVMGLALRNRAMTAALERRVVELRESRRRLVAVQDETRRRLERDLHDGAQQQLVALSVKLGLARTIAEKDRATSTVEALQRLAGDADRVVDTVRDFARGVYPPLLEAEGLGPTVTAQARRSPIPVKVCADGLARYDRAVESTINVCVVEALRNTARHANASRVVVTIAQQDGVVSFDVCDDGSGFDPSTTPRGAGLTNLADRIDALAGTLSVRTVPGGGTTIAGTIPVVEVATS